MTKYKALFIGRSKTYLKDIFFHMDDSFELISSSGIWDDISAHLKLFEPEVILFMHDDYSDEVISQIKSISKHKSAEGVPMVAVCDDDNAERIRMGVPELDIYIVTRPISIQLLKEKVYDHVKAKMKRIEARKAAAEAAAAAAVSTPEDDILAQLKADFDQPVNIGGGSTGTVYSSRKKNILIIDDDKTILKMLKAALEDDYNVTAMAGSKMAYKFLETKPVDLILLDYEMPLESGPEVLKRIRNEMGLTSIPVVFLTGVSEADRIKEVLQLKPQGYLLKPIDIERLNKTIKELV